MPNIPIITFDMRKTRIRIYKQTLRLMNRPKYIRILINPEQSILAIQSIPQAKGEYHRIDWRLLDSHNSCEIYSTFLSEKIREICVDWEKSESVRITGKYYVRDNIACFNLKEAVPISTQEEELYE